MRHTRECPTLSDRDLLACGIIRTLDNAESGRGFLQDYAGRVIDLPDVCPELTTFFTALRSKRRLDLAIEAATAVADRLARDPSLARENRLQVFSSLDGFDIYAGDGHFHAAAAHDARAEDDKKYAVGHLFTLNLRSHAQPRPRSPLRGRSGQSQEGARDACAQTPDYRDSAPGCPGRAQGSLHLGPCRHRFHPVG
ncbi:MAG: hypothetical protein R3F19_33260 [Verrucomicrobiales bacterium]